MRCMHDCFNVSKAEKALLHGNVEGEGEGGGQQASCLVVKQAEFPQVLASIYNCASPKKLGCKHIPGPKMEQTWLIL